MSLWLIFIILLIVLLTVKDHQNDNEIPEQGSNDLEQTTEVSFKEYDTMINSLLISNYTYSYKIENESLYLFNGTKCKDVDTGYKETNAGIIKYTIKNNKYYIATLEGEEEVLNLYEDVDTNFLDLSMLFGDLQSYKYNATNDNNKRIINYEKEGYQVSITTNLDNIEVINIIDNETKYELKYSNITAAADCVKNQGE